MQNQHSAFGLGAALPFKTQDAILANCLLAAGFTETIMSPVNVYDQDILFKAGGGIKDKDGKTLKPSRYAGLSIVEAGKRAHKEGHRGRVEYHFNHHPDMWRFREIYQEQCKEIEEGEKTVDASKRLIEIIESNFTNSDIGVVGDTREVVFRVLCIALKLRIEFVNRWKKQTPYLWIKRDGKQTLRDGHSPGEKFLTHPGGTLVPLSATEQTFKNLGLI